ncbi:MMS19 nucleotide excision repair protein [Episyrphus balteatus]|uniref:MMS19 nucleotide excision repair protein n=1 Tax=Episyrphus balteatus TaxID=286459 RepID=UPI0024853B30|nr:MMS19 nucleotide excision repair protein [Episyrphus balteatus]
MHLKQEMENLNDVSLSEAFKNDETLNKKSIQIAQNITNKDYDIAIFVEKLGFALTSPTLELRVNGTKLLSSVLSQLPRDHLTNGQIEFVATFYADRMKDQHNVLPAVIDGIAAIISMKNFPDASVVTILQSFFQHTTCQSQVRNDREKIFKILKMLSENHENVLKSMGGDFIYGLISSLDGERDPRNLEFIFTFMPDLIQRYPLLHLNEEMFEIFACYFPIDFNPSKTDPEAITRDNLATKLCNCLVASEEFVEWSVPLALEKLESDLIVAKLDSLELLYAIAQKFPPKILELHFEQIWPALKLEIFPGPDNQDILNAGLRTLRSILERASEDPTVSQNYQTIILGTVLPHLNDMHQRLFNPSTAIALVCVSGDAKFASEKILNSFLLKLHSDEDLSFQDKLQIFYILAQVFKLCTLRNAMRQISSNITSELHAEFLKELKNEASPLDLKKAALACLNESFASTTQGNRILVYQSLVQILTSDDLEIDLKDILKHITELDPKELQTECVDKIIRNFPIFSPFVKRKIYNNFLHLIKFKAFSQTVYDLIFSNIFENDSPEVRLIALDALVTLLQQENTAFIKDLQMNESLIGRIFSLVQSGVLSLEILERCAAVLSLIMKHLPVAEQYMIITEYLPKLNLQLVSDLFLTKGLLGFMHESITIDEHFENLANDLIQLSLTNDNEILRKVCHHLLCSLFNKMEDSETNRGILNRIIHKLKEEIKQNKHKAVEILSWIGKGLNILGHELMGDIIETIAELLDHPTLSSAAKLAFDIISFEYPEIHLPCIRFLFKQKFFNVIYSKIAHKLECFSENHINAFIYVLKATPQTVLQMNIEKIGPVLFKCLELNEVQTIRISLEICENFVKTKDVYFSGHLNHLVPQCLKLTQYKSSMNVRITALNLLYEITKYPTFYLLPLKMDVVLGLSPALDDQKRLVRTAAVKASNAWFLIGEPTGD